MAVLFGYVTVAGLMAYREPSQRSDASISAGVR